MPTDVEQFERTFADLAYASMKSRAPMLMEHVIGWQLIDVSEDETRAIGIFGFKIGEQWLYAPVFFMNGELKGKELLYLKGQDIFVPLQENWINYIVNRRPYVLGETEPFTLEQLGYRPPDFTQYSESPETKRAMYEPLMDGLQSEWAKDAVASIFSIMPSDFKLDRFTKSADRLHLPDFLDSAGIEAQEVFLQTMRNDEKFASAVLQFYDIGDFRENPRNIFTEKKATVDHKITGTAPEVVVTLPGNNYADGALKDMTDAEKEQLMQGEIVIQDHRQNTSNVYPADVHKRLFSPTESGCYDILMRDGQFKKLVAIHSPHTIDANSRGNILLLDQNTGDYMLIHATSVYSKKRYYDDSWREMFEGLSNPTPAVKGAYIFIGPDGSGTIPFRVREINKDKQGRTYLKVYSRGESQGGHALIGNTYRNYASSYSQPIGLGTYGDETILIGETKSRKIRSAGNTLFLPDEFKAVKVNDEYDTHKQLDPGTMADLEMAISKLGSMFPLKIYSDGQDIRMSSGSAHFPPMSKNAALRDLIIKWGMSEQDARDLIKEAVDAGGMRNGRGLVRAKVLIKSAQGYGAARVPENRVSNEVTAPYYRGNQDDKNMGFDALLGVNAQHPYYSDPKVPIPQDPIPLQPYNATADYSNPMQAATDAARTGQKEVFDTATVGRLTKMVDIGETVDQYLSDLVNGMDRVGRTLFLFYWHFDKFEDRYGKEDLPELEDSLKNVFKAMGDLILFLKQKSIEPEVNLGLPLMAGTLE